jgi:hypothetical protein
LPTRFKNLWIRGNGSQYLLKRHDKSKSEDYTSKNIDFNSFIMILESNGDRNVEIPVTPSAQLIALYAEYDDLLDTLDILQSKLNAQSRYNIFKRNELRRKVHVICEKLADVHEKIADYDFVIMPGV